MINGINNRPAIVAKQGGISAKAFLIFQMIFTLNLWYCFKNQKYNHSCECNKICRAVCPQTAEKKKSSQRKRRLEGKPPYRKRTNKAKTQRKDM
ncbi:MAG: hypothetical protein IKK26_07050 [Clostridia bacterium]|nr:hypothetical protein [Clostridia bacterium]